MRQRFQFLLRRLVPLMLVGLVMAACTDEKHAPAHRAATPAVTASSGAPLPAQGIQAIAKQLKLPTLAKQRAVSVGDFTQGGHYFTLGSVGGERPFVATHDAQTAVRLLHQRVNEGTINVTIFFPAGDQLLVSYDLKLDPVPGHLLLYMPLNAAFQRIAAEAGSARSNLHAFSVRLNGQRTGYALSLMGDAGATPVLKMAGTSERDTNVYVELCQTSVDVTVSDRSLAALRLLPNWNSADEPRILRLLNQAGQSAVCTGLGVAIGLARAGVPYDRYTQAVSNAALNQFQGIQVGLVTVQQSTYRQYAR